MFRELQRAKQQLSADACTALLQNEKRGVLSVLGDDGYPYAVPINFYYSASENKIYFHSGKYGHKIDAIGRHDKVSFCVYDQGHHKDGHWSLYIQSVIVFGKIRPVENWSYDVMVSFCKKFTDDMTYIENEIKQFASDMVVLELSIAHMTGKLVHEA